MSYNAEMKSSFYLKIHTLPVVCEISHHDARQLEDSKRVLHHETLDPLQGGQTGLYIANLIRTHIRFV